MKETRAHQSETGVKNTWADHLVDFQIEVALQNDRDLTVFGWKFVPTRNFIIKDFRILVQRDRDQTVLVRSCIFIGMEASLEMAGTGDRGDKRRKVLAHHHAADEHHNQ